MKINQYFCFVLLLFYGITSYAQQHNFTNYSVNEGLAQSQVSALLEDSKGYLWLGTSGGGLCRFDGKQFTTFTTQDGLSSNYINEIFEDQSGNLWISTAAGINTFTNGEFSIAGKGTVSDFLQDENGRLWMLVDGALTHLENLDNAPFSKGQKNDFEVLYQTRNGQIWLGGKSGLYRLINNNLIEVKTANGENFKNIRAIIETAEGVLWVASYNQGILLINEEKVVRQLSQKDGLTSIKIQTLAIDKSENIWFGTADRGAIIWNPKTRTFTNLTTQQGLANNQIEKLIADSWGNVWLGTSGGGVSKYSGQQFEHFTAREGLHSNYIRAIEKDEKGQIWVATSENGVQVYTGGEFQNFSDNSTLNNTACQSIFADKYGHLWFGTDKGLTVFLDSLYLTFTIDNGLAGNSISEISQDTLGNIWVVSKREGLTKIVWNDSLPSQSIFTKFTTENGLPNNRINDLHIDKKNGVWLATNGGGIALIEDEQVSKVFTKKEGLLENVIRSFSEDELGYLWYGTASFGIGNIRLYENDFTVNNNYKNLTSSNIKLLKNDAENNLWVGSETGLDYLKLDATRNIIDKDHFGKVEGFRGIETSQNVVIEDAENNLWFGTVNGLTKYNKSVNKGKAYPPKIYLKNVQLLEQDLKDTPYKDWLTNWTNLSLNHDENELTFMVEALHLSYPEKILYQWKLEGKNKGWSTPSSVNKSYQRVFLPGKYELKVRATTENGSIYSETLSFPFEIAQPVWQTWWFRITAGLVGLLLVTLFIKWRIGLVQKRAKRIQDRLELDKKLLELEQKALQLQMNPHFIFNALNSIQGSINPTEIKTARLQLAKFSKLMRATLENARVESIPLEEEINTLSNYLSLEQFSQGDTFDFEIKVADNIDPESIYLPSMILQPFVENAIIHGVAHLAHRGEILVEFTRIGKRLSCIIEDNGIGRAKAKALKSQIEEGHKSVALDITKERLDLMRSGKAAKNSLKIIDLKDVAGNGIGTRVELIIPVEED